MKVGVIFCPLADCGWWNTNPDREQRIKLERRHWEQQHEKERPQTEAGQQRLAQASVDRFFS